MTSDDRWQRVKQCFVDALEVPVAERTTFVASRAGGDPDMFADVMKLLDEHASPATPLDRGLERLANAALGTPNPARIDASQFLPYRLISPIGEGGMGVVYLAERPDLEMRVAVKILRDAMLSPSRRERFAAEQRTLARLTHPGIARIYDSRTLADGTPWFVLEYVEGLSLTDYCQANACSLERRLQLFASVCDAVQYAHENGVVHRDLKPSNILVRSDGSISLLDFGIARRFDISAADAKPITIPLMTPAYASPEQLRGESGSVASDVYSLGVILYELLTGKMPPRENESARSGVARGLDVICDVAMHAEPGRRYGSVRSLEMDVRRYIADEPLEARADPLSYRVRRWLRRNARIAAVSTLLLTGGVIAGFVFASPEPYVRADVEPSVAVMPLRSLDGDTSIAYLRESVASEIATILGFRKGLIVRPFSATRATPDTADPRRVAAALNVANVITGSLLRRDSIAVINLQAIDVASGAVRWRDSLLVATSRLVTLQSQVDEWAHGSLAPALGAQPIVTPPAPRPRSEEAYQLYLRATSGFDAGASNLKAIALLERSVALDSNYSPAWFALAQRYYLEARYQSGDPAMLQKSTDASQRAFRHDPAYALAGVTQAVLLIERGETARAFRESVELLRHRPDNADAHFVLSYVLRFAGLLKESARECGIALSINRNNLRSCAVPSILMGDYEGAQGYLALDQGTAWHRAMNIHMLARAGRVQEALTIEDPRIPQWKSYSLLLACIGEQPRAVLDSLAASVQVSGDPESNYFAASHLAHCDRGAHALGLLERAIAGGYCSYPVIDTEPYFARLRANPRFAEIRAKAADCQAKFLAATRAG